jgi:hypothetical protein
LDVIQTNMAAVGSRGPASIVVGAYAINTVLRPCPVPKLGFIIGPSLNYLGILCLSVSNGPVESNDDESTLKARCCCFPVLGIPFSAYAHDGC